MRHELVDRCAARIHETRTKLNIKPKWTVIDPSARNKNHATGRSVQMEYMEQGIYTLPGQNSRPAGINRLATWLEKKKLLLWAGNEELREEFETHRWKNQKGEEETKEEVIKVNDDILDPLRYILMSLPAPGRLEPETVDLSASDLAFRDSLSRLSRRPSQSDWGTPVLPRR
jgi:hypothetical protein